MHYLQNHCWCSDSIWGGLYDCKHMVVIEKYLDYKNQETPDTDWSNYVKKKEYMDQEEYEFLKEVYEKCDIKDPEPLLQIGAKTFTLELDPKVVKWLEINIKDREGSDINKGWAIGTEEFYKKNYNSFGIFFDREEDAMMFIEKFSEYKIPTYHLNYFKDVRKQINFKTKKLELVKR